MPSKTGERTYFDLRIIADSPSIEIWLGDDAGHLVQKEVGELRTSLIPGDYVVEFGLGTLCYPIRLREDSKYTQSELRSGPSCERPAVRFSDEDS
jgi:hypothetical protein